MTHKESILKEFKRKFTYHGNGKWYIGDETSRWFANQEHFESFLSKALDEQEKTHRAEIGAWHTTFGSTQLTHAIANVEADKTGLLLKEDEVLSVLPSQSITPLDMRAYAKAIIKLQEERISAKSCL